MSNVKFNALASLALLAGALGVAGRDFFDSFEVKVGAGNTAKIMQAAVAAGYNLRRVDDETVGISVDETTTRADIDALVAGIGDVRRLFGV